LKSVHVGLAVIIVSQPLQKLEALADKQVVPADELKLWADSKGADYLIQFPTDCVQQYTEALRRYAAEFDGAATLAELSRWQALDRQALFLDVHFMKGIFVKLAEGQDRF
jgi:hypothetical protein